MPGSRNSANSDKHVNQGQKTYSSQAGPGPLPVFVNKVLLGYRHAHLCMCDLGLFHAANSLCDRGCPAKLKTFTIWLRKGFLTLDLNNIVGNLSREKTYLIFSCETQSCHHFEQGG